MQAAKLVFQQFGQELQDKLGNTDAAPASRVVIGREQFQSRVLQAVMEITEKAVGEFDLRIACRQECA